MRRGVRLRITLLYTALFLGSGAVLLVLTNALAIRQETSPAPGQVPPSASERIRALEDQLTRLHDTQSRQLLVGSLIALLVMAAVSVVLGNVVAGRVLRPLRMITATTRQISAENLHERLAVDGPVDEVKDLADTIDGLLERLEASFAAQRRFVANASHELRTPLTTMRASLDVAEAKPRVPAPTTALAGRMRTELDRLDRLLDGLLVLARAEHGADLERDRLSLPALVVQAVARRAGDAADRRVAVETDLADVAWTQGSAPLLGRLVDNVLDNAIRHNHVDGWIRVTTRSDGEAELVVESSGPVLDPEQVALLAEPFQRLGADRTGSERGSGLGLSIVVAIAEAHGGRLSLHARPEGGLRVTVSLPLSPTLEGVPA